ncbi:hypothetical protein DB347_22700 [Opitutaceae bacterium EW11]|nr:hypothetical protein DB347_22700 [Opitutaceae bacterium EW11]
MFAGFVHEVFPEQKKKPVHGVWYAVLHLFSPNGEYLSSSHFRQTTERGDSVYSVLGSMIRQLSAVSFEDISVAPFSTKIDGTLWGLVDISDPGAETSRAELRPLGQVYGAPWDGRAEEHEPRH